MAARFFCLILLTGICWGNILIISPKHNQVITDATIDFVAKSPVNAGFFLVNNELIPIRKRTVHQKLPLQLGLNQLHIHVLSEELKIQPAHSKQVTVYRYLPLEGGIQHEMAHIMTDLSKEHGVHWVSKKDARLDKPIFKKDIYALLAWFHKDREKKRIQHDYEDMAHDLNYLAMYEFFPQILPAPIRGLFYPNSYVTRRDLMNLLLILNGSSEQLSTSMMVSSKLRIPSSLEGICPKSWQKPMVFVTRREALSIFLSFFKFDQLIEESVVNISWVPQFAGLKDVVLGKWKGIKLKAWWPEQSKGWSLADLNDWRLTVTSQIKRGLFEPWQSKKNAPHASHARLPRESKTTINMHPKEGITRRMPKKRKRSVVVVQRGDSIQKIAKRYYGDSSKWKLLADINQLTVKNVTVNGKVISRVHIEPGQTLLLQKGNLPN